MSVELTAELLGAGLKPAFKTIELRDGEYTVNVRGLSIAETIKFVELRDLEETSEREKLDAMIDIVLSVCVDSDGRSLFSSDDRDAIAANMTASELALIVEATADVEAADIEGK